VKRGRPKEILTTDLFFETNGQDYFTDFFNQSPFAIAFTDAEGNIILGNSQFEKLELLSLHKIPFVSLVKNFSSRSHSASDTLFNDGLGLLKITALKLNANENNAAFLWLIQRDTDLALTRKVNVLKNLYRSFIDTTFELVIRTTVEGKILFGNQLFRSSFGFTNYKKVKNSSMVVLFEDPNSFYAIQKKIKTEKKFKSAVIFFRKENGERLTGRVNCSQQMDSAGTPILNWTILDVTLQVEFEDDLKTKNEQLAKVNHQMEKFLYSTSHDLRSPITSILGLVNLVRMESSEPVVLDYIAKIEASTLKQDKIIRDIMSFSRASYQRTMSEKIDFEPLIWKAINNHRENSGFKKISFDVKSNNGFPFYADTERLEIVIENIIRNSIHFFDSNKVKSFIRVHVKIDKMNALIEFLDNGIGIGQQHIAHIFNMFYKASHLSKGAGLGLYIVKETVEKLSGQITIESEIGFGTVVRVTIPNDHKGRLIGRKLDLIHQS
jgi:signal transduction histidine kinase